MLKTLNERFFEKVLIIPFHECWEWLAFKNERGYGRINLGPRGLGVERAHRVSWLIHKGLIPKDLCVLHKCDNPSCVRPEHLFLGTRADNVKDMILKKRGQGHFSSGKLDPRSNGGKHNILKMFCPKKHPYSGDNLYVNKRRRRCRQCMKGFYEANKQKRIRVAKAV